VTNLKGKAETVLKRKAETVKNGSICHRATEPQRAEFSDADQTAAQQHRPTGSPYARPTGKWKAESGNGEKRKHLPESDLSPPIEVVTNYGLP
jgi:hypothetical protein